MVLDVVGVGFVEMAIARKDGFAWLIRLVGVVRSRTMGLGMERERWKLIIWSVGDIAFRRNGRIALRRGGGLDVSEFVLVRGFW